MTRSNCILWAIPRWLQKTKPGEESYLVIRRSRIAWGFVHMLHGTLDPQTGQLKLTSYKPPHGHVKTEFAPVFHGEVIEGDQP